MSIRKNFNINDSRLSELERARRRLGLTLEDVAFEVGLTPQTIHHYELYKRFARPEHAWSLIEFYESRRQKISLYDFYPKELFKAKHIPEEF